MSISDREQPEDGLPPDASRIETNKPIQQAANNRGLYVTQDGVITYLDDFQCNGFELQMHRGHPKRPENSQSSVIAAIEANAPVIEIDAMILDDDFRDQGYWVVHHDERSGRAVSHPTDGPNKLAYIEGDEWYEYRLRDPETGELTPERPVFLSEILKLFAKKADPDQTLHIEIKHDWDKDQIRRLEAMSERFVGNDQIRYSSFSLEALSIIRDRNSDVYLGVIQKPHRYSLNQVRREIHRAATGDKDYDRYSHWLDTAMRHYSRDNLMRMSRVRHMERVLGSNSGLHIDVRDAVLNASSMERIQRSGMTVATYSINGQDYHESRLKMAMDRGFKPKSVIMDETPYGFCGQFYQPSRRNGLPPDATTRAQILDELPLDADLRREDILQMARDGLYVNLSGEVKSLSEVGRSADASSSGASASSSERAFEVDLSVGDRQAEEDFSLEDNDGPLVIDKETLE